MTIRQTCGRMSLGMIRSNSLEMIRPFMAASSFMVKRIFTPVEISARIRSVSPSAASRSSSSVLARSTRRPMTWE
ncbi:hypothetical protein D3C78_976810 [compost metagenome]